MPKTKYIWDEDNILYETDGNDAVTAQYTYSPEQYGNLISEHRNGTTYTHYYDAQGSTVALTDDTGHVTDTFVYNAWGEEVARTGTTETPWRWVGRVGYFYDIACTAIAVRRRVAMPLIARWLTYDPLVFIDGPNRYLLSRNSPTQLTDPSGLIAPKCGTCGPEVLPALTATIATIRGVLKSQDFTTKLQSCGLFLVPPIAINPAWMQWDITGLVIPGNTAPFLSACPGWGADPCCSRCVMVGGYRQDKWDVNYILWGLLQKWCDAYLAEATLIAAEWKAAKAVFGKTTNPCELKFQYTDAVQSWITAGWYGFDHPLSQHMPKSDNALFKHCNKCKGQLPPTKFAYRLYLTLPGDSTGLGGSLD